MNSFIIDVAGSAKLKFEPGHYCGKNWGYCIQVENWMIADSFRHPDGFSAGGVIDFKDIEKLYKTMIEYKKHNKRVPVSELFDRHPAKRGGK